MRVGVLFGGASVEHDISLVTASQIMASLEGDEYEVIPLYLEKNGKIVVTEKFLSQKDLKDKRIKFSESDEKRFKGKIWANFKEKKRVDVILPAIHGKFLEGGEIYGFCKTMHIPYAFSNCLASSISQSKIFTKKLSKILGLNCLDYVYFSKREFYDNKEKFIEKVNKIGYPLVIKANELGSSIGLYLANNEFEAINGIEKAFLYDEKVLVEKKIGNFLELNCAYLKTYDKEIISSVDEVKNESEIYSFEKKYEKNRLKHIIPAAISKELEDEIKLTTKKVIDEIDGYGVLRVDYMYDLDNNCLYLNEINSIPGAYAYYLFEEQGIYFDELLDYLIEGAIKRHYMEEKLVNKYQSNVLDIGENKA